MADDNRFFRWLWRINSLLFFIGVAALIGLVGIPLFLGTIAPRAAPQTAQATDDGYTYEFSGGLGDATNSSLMTRLDGTDEGIMVLQRNARRGSYGLRSGGRSYDTGMVNLLSFDLKTMKNRWLFHGVKHDIESVYQIHAFVPVPQNAPDPVIALLMGVAGRDTNGDGKITAADRHALYVYRVGSAEPVKLIDAWAVSGVQQLDGERIAVTYYDGEADHAVLISAKDFKVAADTILSATPK